MAEQPLSVATEPSPASQARPNFFIVGHSKSGTTALYKFLSEHPDVWMSDPKEPNYFATDFCQGVTAGAYIQRTEEEYLSLFNGWNRQRAVGEASACYLFSEEAAAHIARFNPDARIIIMLREPVSFLHSYHMQRLKNPATEGEDVKDFARALALEERRKRGLDVPKGCLTPQLLYYSERIKYAEQVQRFLDRFPTSQVHIIIYDEFKRNNACVYRDVCAFLNIDASYQPAFTVHNKGQLVRSKRAQNMLRDLTHGSGKLRGVKQLITLLFPPSLRRKLTGTIYKKVVFEPKTQLDPAFVRDLKRSFKPEVKKISDLLGRDLVTLWNYDQV